MTDQIPFTPKAAALLKVAAGFATESGYIGVDHIRRAVAFETLCENAEMADYVRGIREVAGDNGQRVPV